MDDIFSNEQLMEAAVAEQDKCLSYPKVGAVIARDGKILSRAFRLEVPKKHAERIAIEKLEPADLKGATIYTTLEPCVEMHEFQPHKSCAIMMQDLQVEEVIIGVLDPNGKIYCQGYDLLLGAGVKVSFFTPSLRELIEKNTFKFGDCDVGYGPSGKRRVAVVGSGKKFSIRFSPKDATAINFRWDTLQFKYGIVDLVAGNDSIRCAIGAKEFADITDPLVFRDPAHYARMKKGDIATIFPQGASFVTLIKLLDITEFDITFQWQVRKI